MGDNVIVVGGVRLPRGTGTPVTFQGVHSGKLLAGIDVQVTAVGQGDRALVEGLFTPDPVAVDDPFAVRSYHARVRQVSNSYTEGRPERHYVFEVREEDTMPEVTTLEIEGHAFTVTQYHEEEARDGIFIRSALLRLNDAQLGELRGLLRPGTFRFKRVDVDAAPLIARYGGALYWSRHDDEGDVYYKHIVRFISSEKDDTKKRAGLASSTEVESLTHMVRALQARFLALVDDLAASNAISNARRETLLGPDWTALLDEARMAEIGWQTTQVPDAEDELA